MYFVGVDEGFVDGYRVLFRLWESVGRRLDGFGRFFSFSLFKAAARPSRTPVARRAPTERQPPAVAPLPSGSLARKFFISFFN